MFAQLLEQTEDVAPANVDRLGLLDGREGVDLAVDGLEGVASMGSRWVGGSVGYRHTEGREMSGWVQVGGGVSHTTYPLIPLDSCSFTQAS